MESCLVNGVGDIVEIKTGNDGITRANAKGAPFFSFNHRHLLIVEKLVGDPSALGIFGYSFLDRNRDLIQSSSIAADRPERHNIASGRYSLVRPLDIHVKENRMDKAPGLREYVDEFTNEWTLGPDGYLVDDGLIPLPKEERKRNHYTARKLTPLSIDEL